MSNKATKADTIFTSLLNALSIETVTRNPVGSNYGEVSLPVSKEWAYSMSDAGNAIFGSGAQCRKVSDVFGEVESQSGLHWQQMVTLVSLAHSYSWDKPMELMGAAVLIMADKQSVYTAMTELSLRVAREAAVAERDAAKATAGGKALAVAIASVLRT